MEKFNRINWKMPNVRKLKIIITIVESFSNLAKLCRLVISNSKAVFASRMENEDSVPEVIAKKMPMINAWF